MLANDKIAADASLFRAACYQLIPAIFQQLNFAEWPQFCDHSVTSADVRLSVGPNLSRAACQRPVDFRQSQAWTGGPSERKSALTSRLPVIREESAAPAPGSFRVRSCEIVCQLELQICPAEEIGEARVRAQRIEHGVRFY